MEQVLDYAPDSVYNTKKRNKKLHSYQQSRESAEFHKNRAMHHRRRGGHSSEHIQSISDQDEIDAKMPISIAEGPVEPPPPIQTTDRVHANYASPNSPMTPPRPRDVYNPDLYNLQRTKTEGAC